MLRRRFSCVRRNMGVIYSLFHPNASDSITDGLLVKKSMEKCPKTLKTIKYEPSYALGGAASELQRPAPPPWTGLRHQGRERRGRAGGRLCTFLVAKNFQKLNFLFFQKWFLGSWTASGGSRTLPTLRNASGVTLPPPLDRANTPLPSHYPCTVTDRWSVRAKLVFLKIHVKSAPNHQNYLKVKLTIRQSLGMQGAPRPSNS